MYGLSYAKLDYDYMYELDLSILYLIVMAEMDKEVHQYDIEMMKLSWQTAFLMNATGNYKRAIKPENLYVTLAERNQIQVTEEDKQADIKAKREELLKTFNIKE